MTSTEYLARQIMSGHCSWRQPYYTHSTPCFDVLFYSPQTGVCIFRQRNHHLLREPPELIVRPAASDVVSDSMHPDFEIKYVTFARA